MGRGKGAVKFQEGGDFVCTMAMAPGSGFPQGVMSDCGEVVIGPATFGFSNSAPKRLDGIFAGLALDGGDSSEGGLTVYVPPSEAPEVRRVPLSEQFPQHGIDVSVKGIHSAG